MRIVVKVGTSTLAYPTGRLNIQRMERLCKTLSDLKNAGHEIILVSSGAIAMGFGKLNLSERPKDMPGKQAAAAALCIVVMLPSAWLMQRIVPASWLSYGKGLRYGSAQTVLLALWLVEFGLIYNWVYPNLPNIGIPNVVAAALFAVLTLALRAWRTHRCNQLADARPWRDVVDSKKQ